MCPSETGSPSTAVVSARGGCILSLLLWSVCLYVCAGIIYVYLSCVFVLSVKGLDPFFRVILCLVRWLVLPGVRYLGAELWLAPQHLAHMYVSGCGQDLLAWLHV